jgi:hypothetical protein
MFLLRSRSFVNHRHGSPCWSVIWILFSVNRFLPHMLLHQALSSLHIERNISTCWNKDWNWPKIEWKCKLTKAELICSFCRWSGTPPAAALYTIVSCQSTLSQVVLQVLRVIESIEKNWCGDISFGTSNIQSHSSSLPYFPTQAIPPRLHTSLLYLASNHWFASHRRPTSNNP